MSADRVLAVDVGGTKVALAVADPDAAPHLLARTTVATDANEGGLAVLQRVLRAATRLADSAGGVVRTVGISTIGVPTARGGLELAPTIPGWDGLDIATAVADALGVDDVRVDNDVKCGATAEMRWGALIGVDEALYVNLGTGIAAAVVSGGRIVRGAHNAAGEIGYSLRCVRDAPQRVARLEEHAGGRALAALFAAYDEDAQARRELAAALDEIAFCVTNLAIALDPQVVVCNGGFLRTAAPVLAALRNRLDACMHRPEVTAGRFPFDAPLMGAVALATPRPQRVEALVP